MFQSIDKTTLKTITQKETAKQLWDSMKMKHQGSARVKRAQLQRLWRIFETLEMKAGEGVSEYFLRVMETAHDMRNCGESMEDVKIVEKILRSTLRQLPCGILFLALITNIRFDVICVFVISPL